MTQILPPLVLPSHAPGTPSNPNQGPQGPAGAPGADGEPGSTGPEGPQGPAGSGGDGYGSNVFVYRSNAISTGPNVFLTFQEAYDAAIATGVPATIAFDDRLGQCDIFAGTYNISQTTFSGGFTPDNQAVVFIHDGAIFNSIYKVTDNINLLYDSASSPLISIDDNNQELYLDRNAVFTIINTSPFYALTDGAYLQVHMGNSTAIQPTGSSPVITLDESEADFIFEGVDCTLNADTFNGTGNSSDVEVIVLNASANSVPSVLNGFLGDYDYQTNVQARFIFPLVGNTADRPTAPIVKEGMMYYDEQISLPVWWNGSSWKTADKPYQPEYQMITLDSPQTTGLVTGGHLNFNTVLVSNPGGGFFGGYSSPGRLFINFNATDVNVSHKLVANLGDFDGNLIYQWWDITSDVGLGNVGSSAGNGKSGDVVAIIPRDYKTADIAIFVELRFLFVGGTTSIGENTAGGFVLPWLTIETLGSPVINGS